MSDMLGKARVAVAALHGANCDTLVQGLRQARTAVETCETIDALVSTAMAGDLHAVVLATKRPQDLPRSAMQSLLSVDADLCVTVLVPNGKVGWDCRALRAATLDQVQDLDRPAEELVAALRTKLLSVLISQPEYLVACVDDDPDFLASLEALLLTRLERTCPRFRLRFQFFTSPAETLRLLESLKPGELALLISDQIMPEMKGIDLLTRSKAIHPQARRVLLTGYTS